jgi:hypothetical protein
MRRQARHTWTIAIATVVLGAAAGAALARPDASTPSPPITAAQAKTIAKAVADTEIKRLAPTLAVKSAQTAGSAATANAPALYAHVSAHGAVSNSQGITDANITHPRAGFYCFTGLPAAPKGGMAILDTHDAGVDLIQLGVDAFAAFCPPGTQALIATFRPGGAFVDDPFFVAFWS